MSIYKVFFTKSAKKAMDKLEKPIQEQFAKKLAQRLQNPRVEKDKLRDYKDAYKIKLKSAGLRLVYLVEDGRLVVIVLGVGRRENDEVYRTVAAVLKEYLRGVQ